MKCGKSWHALAVLQNFSPSPTSSMKVSKVQQLPYLQQHQAWVHPGPHLVLHLLHHHAPWGKRGPARWHLHPFPNRQQYLSPLASPHAHENHRGTHHWAAVCWWLCPSCPHRGSHTANRQPLLWCSQQLRPHHQPEENWGVVPTPSTWGLQSSSHQHRWHQPKCSGTVHLP